MVSCVLVLARSGGPDCRGGQRGGRQAAKALALQIASDVAHAAAKTAALLAKGADKAAQIAGKVADAAGRTAQTLEAVAARDSAAASSADSAFKSLAAAYARQEAHKLAKIAKATVRALKKAGHAVARAAKAVAKAACKYSGAQDVVGCVTHPSLAGCAKAALTVALTVGTAGEGEIAEIGLNAAEHAGEDLAEEGVGNAVKDAAESCVLGGKSFSADTKVLLADGKAVPISSLKPGEKVLATNTRTGKTRPETISVVMVHHDTNLYDLKIKSGSRIAVINTTSNHPFWDVTAHRWVKAAALRYGTHLRTPAGGIATVLGGRAPQDRSGWMWDLTVPGDHDFYVVTNAADILVHNQGCSDELADLADSNIGRTNVAAEVTNGEGAIGRGISQSRALENLTPNVRTAAQAVGHHMGCAEIGALCDLERQGQSLTGLAVNAVKVAAGNQGYSLEEHLENLEMCSSCRRMVNYLNGG